MKSFVAGDFCIISSKRDSAAGRKIMESGQDSFTTRILELGPPAVVRIVFHIIARENL